MIVYVSLSLLKMMVWFGVRFWNAMSSLVNAVSFSRRSCPLMVVMTVLFFSPALSAALLLLTVSICSPTGS